MAKHGPIRKMIPVDFYTHGHRLSTQIDVFGWPLAARLNDPRVEWIDLETAYVSRIEHLGEIIVDFPISLLHKDDISFALVAGPIEGILKKVPTSMAQYHYSAMVALPAFEVSGILETTAPLDLRKTLLATDSGQFFPLLNPSVTLSTNPHVRLSGELVLVNIRKVEFICSEKKGELVE